MTLKLAYVLLQNFCGAAGGLNAYFLVRNIQEQSWMGLISAAALVTVIVCFIFNSRRMARFRREEREVREWKAHADMVLRSYPLTTFWPPQGDPQTDADRIAIQMQIYRSLQEFRLQRDHPRGGDWELGLELGRLSGRRAEAELEACLRHGICPDCGQVTLDREKLVCIDATCGSHFAIAPTGEWSRA
jgi:hypothetical protein